MAWCKSARPRSTSARLCGIQRLMVPSKTKLAGPRAGKKTLPSTTDDPGLKTKLFVLDTNVLMHDPTSLFRFEEHDLFIPMATLEELDDNKKGMSEVSRNPRQASRYLDELISHTAAHINAGIPLNATGDRRAGGRVFLQ